MRSANPMMLLGGRLLLVLAPLLLLGSIVLVLLSVLDPVPDVRLPAGTSHEIPLQAGETKELFAEEAGSCTAVDPDGLTRPLPQSASTLTINSQHFYSAGQLQATRAGSYTVRCDVAVQTHDFSDEQQLAFGLALFCLASCAGIFGSVMYYFGKRDAAKSGVERLPTGWGGEAEAEATGIEASIHFRHRPGVAEPDGYWPDAAIEDPSSH